VRRTLWHRLPTSETIINIMNDVAGSSGIQLADMLEKSAESGEGGLGLSGPCEHTTHKRS
jgi:hypothetical protein